MAAGVKIFVSPDGDVVWFKFVKLKHTTQLCNHDVRSFFYFNIF